MIRKDRAFQNTDPNEWGSYPGSSAPVSPGLALVGFVGLCLLVGAADGSVVARASHGWYLSLNRPFGTPPDWVFGVVWTMLYAMIGVAGWMGLAAGRQRLLDTGLFRAAQPTASVRRLPRAAGADRRDHPGVPPASRRCRLASNALSRVERLRGLPDRGVLVAQSGLS